MSLQGLPWPSLPNQLDFAEAQFADLSGNAFAGTAILAVVMCLLWGLEYYSESEEELTEMVRVLQRARST